MTSDNSSPTDSAALAGTVVAVAMASFSDDGPYDLLGALVALTLVAIIVGYLWDRPRSRVQSGAMSGVIALLAIMVIGFGWDLITGRTGQSGETAFGWQFQIGVFVTAFALVAATDRRQQNKRGRT